MDPVTQASEVSHKVNANDHGAYVLIAAIFMLVASSIFIPIRLLIRRPWRKMLGYDDCFSLAATVFSALHTAMLCVAVRQGLGKRDDDLSTSALEVMNRSLYISNIFFMPALACSQMAVGALTLRLSRSDSTTLTLLKRLVQANYVTLGIIGLWTIAGIITFAVPIGSKPASATNTQVVAWIAIEVVSFVLEILLVGIPCSLVGSLYMPVAKKATVLSGFVVRPLFHILAIFRIMALQKAATSGDASFALAPAAVWVAIELNLSVAGATLPCLSSFLRMMNSGVLATTATHLSRSAGNSYNLKDGSHLHSSRNREPRGRGPGSKDKHWWDQQSGHMRGDAPDYRVHVESHNNAKDDASTASFGSRQIMIHKTVEARVDDISPDRTP